MHQWFLFRGAAVCSRMAVGSGGWRGHPYPYFSQLSCCLWLLLHLWLEHLCKLEQTEPKSCKKDSRMRKYEKRGISEGETESHQKAVTVSKDQPHLPHFTTFLHSQQAGMLSWSWNVMTSTSKSLSMADVQIFFVYIGKSEWKLCSPPCPLLCHPRML